MNMPAQTNSQERTLTPAARRILDVASDLFYRHGIRAIGVDTIAREANVTKKTIYDRFGSKDALVAAYLEARDRHWHELIEEYVERPEHGPRERILAMFDILEFQLRDRGCAFVNAHAELGGQPSETLDMVRGSKIWLRDFFVQEARKAGAPDPEALASQLLILEEGSMIAHSMADQPDSAKLARAAAEVLVDAALTSNWD